MTNRALWIAAIVLAACGGGADVPRDLGDACADIGEGFCERANTCGLLEGSVTGCTNDFFYACCVETGDCDSPIQQPTAAEWDRCLSDIDRAACTDISNGDFPVRCLQL